jgi:sodium-independent sulfate anion transporter 11
LIATARNALLVLFTSMIAYYYTKSENGTPFILTGTVKSGIPDFKLPSFETTIEKNGTTVVMGFTEMVSELGFSIVLLPVIAVLGNVAISKAFGGSGIDATKELVALSLSNVLGSFVSSIPVTGSFSRSAVNHASGVRTPIGGIYTGLLVLLALGILTPYFQYIPRAALSAVIISAVIFMIEYEVVRPLWKCSRRELITVSLTLSICLLVGVELGLLAGVATDVAFLVHRAARPTLSVEKTSTHSGLDYILVTQRHSLLYFPAIEYVRSTISKALKMHGKAPIVIDCRNVQEFDFTAARGLGSFRKELEAEGVPMLLLGPSSEVVKVIKGALDKPLTEIACESDIDIVLQEISNKVELRDVVSPLLNSSNIDSESNENMTKRR